MCLTFSRQKVVISESAANAKHDCSWPQLTDSTISYFSFYICIPTIFLMSVVTSFSHQNQSDLNVWPKTIKTLATAVQYPQIKNVCIEFYHIFILKAKKKGTKHKISRENWFEKWVVTTTWLIILKEHFSWSKMMLILHASEPMKPVQWRLWLNC